MEETSREYFPFPYYEKKEYKVRRTVDDHRRYAEQYLKNIRRERPAPTNVSEEYTDIDPMDVQQLEEAKIKAVIATKKKDYGVDIPLEEAKKQWKTMYFDESQLTVKAKDTYVAKLATKLAGLENELTEIKNQKNRIDAETN